MKVIEKIKEIINKNEPEIVAKEIANTYIENKENGEENPIDNTVQKAMEIIKQNPRPEKILTAMIEEEKLPHRVIEKTATKISKDKNIPDSIITNAVEKSQIQVPDKVINTIIEEGDLEACERYNLIRNVDNKEIIEQNVENELKILYRLCKEKKDIEVVDRILELKKIVGEKNISLQMNEKIHQIVAKKMAENYYSDFSKSTKLYTLSKAIPVKEMLEKDLPSKVLEEYKKIEIENGVKESRFDKDELKYLMLKELERTEKLDTEKEKSRINEVLPKLLGNAESAKTIFMLNESGLLDVFNNIPEKQRREVMNSISGVLKKSKYRVSKNPPIIQKCLLVENEK